MKDHIGRLPISNLEVGMVVYEGLRKCSVISKSGCLHLEDSEKMAQNGSASNNSFPVNEGLVIFPSSREVKLLSDLGRNFVSILLDEGGEEYQSSDFDQINNLVIELLSQKQLDIGSATDQLQRLHSSIHYQRQDAKKESVI